MKQAVFQKDRFYFVVVAHCCCMDVLGVVVLVWIIYALVLFYDGWFLLCVMLF